MKSYLKKVFVRFVAALLSILFVVSIFVDVAILPLTWIFLGRCLAVSSYIFERILDFLLDNEVIDDDDMYFD